MMYDRSASLSQELEGKIKQFQEAVKALKNNHGRDKETKDELKRAVMEKAKPLLKGTQRHLVYHELCWQDKNAADELRSQFASSDTAQELAHNPGEAIWETIARPEVKMELLPPYSAVFRLSLALDKPYLSRDENLFYIIDNPVRREKVFGQPYVAASSWKGSLRSALRCLGDEKYSDDKDIIRRLFGNERGTEEQERIRSGRLYFYPTFLDRVGLEVINPHDRATRAGRQPIYKERYQGMTMGVITLQGEAQAYLIEDMLLKRLGAEEMEKRRLICGNPYSFQGDERDVMFLSMVAAPNERIGVLTQEADRRRFNVATSRAKDQMWLFHSVTTNHLSVHCFRRRLLDYCYNPLSRITQALGEGADEMREKAFRANRLIEKPPRPFESWFEVDVCLAIAGRGYRVVPQFEFAGKRIDLVVQGAKAQMAVECDGNIWHGADKYPADMERQRKLERCGWHFFRVRESCYYANPEKALESLWIYLERMGILPVSVDVEVDVEIETNNQEESWHNVDEDEEERDVAEDYPEENGADSCEDPEQKQEIDQVYEPSSHEKEGDIPQNIHEALRVKPDFLGRAIIDILRGRPNFSCVREKMPVYILKRWNIRTRGLPREQFAKKVDDLVAVMARKGYVTIYKSKNVRIKLGWEHFPE